MICSVDWQRTGIFWESAHR